MLHRFADGLLALPRLLRVARRSPELWRSYVRLTLLRMLAVTLLAAPLMWLRADDLLDDDDDDDEKVTSVLSKDFDWVVSLAGPLFIAQWVVVAFTREFDDRLSNALALRAEVPPEDSKEPEAPKIRVEWKWIRKRLRRRMQLFAAALPGFILIAFFSALLPDGWATKSLSSALGTVWTFYWLVVGTVSKSAAGWTTEGSEHVPLFIRVLPIKWLQRTWTRMAKALFPPTEMVEREPLAFVGLTLFRLINVVPMITLWTRPLVPVAVSSILKPEPAADVQR